MDASLMAPRIDNFLYLNRDNRWDGFHWHGLEIDDDGSLQLCSLPLFEGDPLLPTESAIEPAGITQAEDGTIYVSDPANHRLFRIGCDGALVPVRCLGERGNAPAQLNTPRGLFIPKYRQAIFVADSKNHRVQVFDLASGQLVDIWGPISAMHEPRSNPGQFNTPWAITGDDSGNVYIVDYGDQRIQKFNRNGELVRDFWHAISQAHFLSQPSDIATYSRNDSVRLYIVDETEHAVFVTDGHGERLRDAHNHFISFGTAQLRKPMGIAAAEDAVYVGDNELHRILKFSAVDYSYLGEAVNYEGPIAGLLLDNWGSLLVHTGGTATPIQLPIGAGRKTKGVLWSDAISVSDAKVVWHRVQAKSGELPANVHLRLFFHTSDDRNDQPPVDLHGSEPFADPRWNPPAATPDPFSDTHDLFIGGPPSRYLWIGALFFGDGRGTPVVPQMRVEFDHDGYLDELPAIFQREPAAADFLLRFLALTETLFQDLENSIQGLSRLFDPNAVPKEFLPWLATWLALTPDEDRNEQEQRQLIASAFERYGRRGTVAGLRESLHLFAGVNAIVHEPILNAAWWSLPSSAVTCKCHKSRSGTRETEWQATENSILGQTTMLAAGQPQGAVLGTTATLDYSNLITNEEFGAPLFEDVAHQFTVQIHRPASQCAKTMTQVRAVLDQEKPAHTDYHLCIIEPRMRVGFQAAVGIDTVIAGSAEDIRLGRAILDGMDAIGGEPAGKIGAQSRIGIGTRLG